MGFSYLLWVNLDSMTRGYFLFFFYKYTGRSRELNILVDNYELVPVVEGSVLLYNIIMPGGVFENILACLRASYYCARFPTSWYFFVVGLRM